MPHVFVFMPKSASANLAGLRSRVVGHVRHRGWALNERPVTVQREAGQVSQEDADLAYRRAHVERVAVLCLQEPGQPGTACVLPPDPVAKSSQRWVSLRCLVRHKAFFRRLRTDRDDFSWVSAFEAWCSRVECSGMQDPRILPLHVFAADPRWSRLLTHSVGQGQFDARFGRAQSREDERRFIWKPADPNARHMGGGTVTGHELPNGFHWDVNTNGASRELCTLTQRWEVRSYLNIAPNGNAVGRPPYAKRLYPK